MRRSPTLPKVLALAGLVLAMAGCGPGLGVATKAPSAPSESVGSSPSAQASPVPSTSLPPTSSPSAPPTTDVFESTRHGYRVEVPAGWVVNEYEGSWDTLSQFTPGGEIPGEDAVAPLDFSSFLVMNSMAIPGGMTDREWLSAFDAVVAAGLPAGCPGTTESGTFAGEAAMIREQSCPDATIVGRSLVHGGRGYYFTTKSPPADPESDTIVDRLAASISFTE